MTEKGLQNETTVRDELVRRLQELRNGNRANFFCGCNPELRRAFPEKCRHYLLSTPVPGKYRIPGEETPKAR